MFFLKLIHGKEYSSPKEEKYRMAIFLKNKLEIDEHNMKFDRGEVTYKMDMQEDSDLTFDEIKIKYGIRDIE